MRFHPIRLVSSQPKKPQGPVTLLEVTNLACLRSLSRSRVGLRGPRALGHVFGKHFVIQRYEYVDYVYSVNSTVRPYDHKPEIFLGSAHSLSVNNMIITIMVLSLHVSRGFNDQWSFRRYTKLGCIFYSHITSNITLNRIELPRHITKNL